jgi:hypothetical protein
VFRRSSPFSPGDDDVVQEAEADDFRRSAQCVRRSKVFRPRGRVARRVVVGDSERPTVVAQHGVQDLTHRQEGAVEAAFAYRNHSPELIRSVTNQHDRSLTGSCFQLANRDGGDVGGGSKAQWGCVGPSESGQAE